MGNGIRSTVLAFLLLWLALFIGGALNPGSAAAGMGAAPVYTPAGGDSPTLKVVSFDGATAEMELDPVAAVFLQDPRLSGTRKDTDKSTGKPVWILPARANLAYFADKELCALPLGKGRWGGGTETPSFSTALGCGPVDERGSVRFSYRVPPGGSGEYPEPVNWAFREKADPKRFVTWGAQAENSKHLFLRHDNQRVHITVFIVNTATRRIRLVSELTTDAERQELNRKLQDLR
ncbi:MAG: hypothetical protein Q8R13_00705 [bacterium]|nr:hypothetical protein [bacterium]